MDVGNKTFLGSVLDVFTYNTGPKACLKKSE